MVRFPVSLPDPLLVAPALALLLPELLQAAAVPRRAKTAPAAATRRPRPPRLKGLPRPLCPGADLLDLALGLMIVFLR